MSEKQLPKYFKWNGTTIRGATRILPKSFYVNKNHTSSITRIEDLKGEYKIGKFVNGKLKSSFGCTDLIDNNDGNKYLLVKFQKGLDPSDLGSYIPVISNPKKVGTPRWYLIKGQDIYSGNLREHQRGFIMDSIKKSFLPYLKDLKPITNYPIKIRCELHDTVKNPYHNIKGETGGHWDVDNYLYPYNKAFPDLLTAQGIIRDDDRIHFPGTIKADFVPIDNHEDRKLVYIIEKDERPEVNTKTFIGWINEVNLKNNYVMGIDPYDKKGEENEKPDVIF